METTIVFATAQLRDESEIRELLKKSALPDEDIADHLKNFIVATDGSRLLGCVGLEVTAGYGLLRSLAVDESSRSRGFGQELCQRVLKLAADRGFTELYLLTTSAAGYFERHGWSRITRDSAPEPIQQTRQFQGLCPTSAVLMRIGINHGNTETQR